MEGETEWEYGNRGSRAAGRDAGRGTFFLVFPLIILRH